MIYLVLRGPRLTADLVRRPKSFDFLGGSASIVHVYCIDMAVAGGTAATMEVAQRLWLRALHSCAAGRSLNPPKEQHRAWNSQFGIAYCEAVAKIIILGLCFESSKVLCVE